MKMKIFLLVLFSISTFVLAQSKSNELSKVTTNDDYNFINVNNIKMWVSNTGLGSHNPLNDAGGFFWADYGNSNTTAVFMDGLIIGAKVNDEIRISGTTYRTSLQSGKILSSGLPDDPSLKKYRVYKIRNDWENQIQTSDQEQYEKDYCDWPFEDGAPFGDINNDGKYTPGVEAPFFEGDEVLWFVANDFDTTRAMNFYYTPPMGLEIQTTIFGFDKTGILGNTVFKKYKLINKGNNYLNETYIGIWSDVDLGFALDDYAGYDTSLNMAYAYNADNFDENNYLESPPAIGYVFLNRPIIPAASTDSARVGYSYRKGFKNTTINSFLCLDMVSDTSEIWPTEEPYKQMYNFFNGNTFRGYPLFNSLTGEETKFHFTGDPANKTGWYEGMCLPGEFPPGDRRFLLSTGPFNMAPGDTQEVVFAITIARGENNLKSISELRKNAIVLRNFYKYYVPEKTVINPNEQLPEYYDFSQNYPNPFNPTTNIKYSLPVGQYVVIKIFNLLGEQIAVLENSYRQAGDYSIMFDGTNLTAGIYFCSIEAGIFSRVKKMILLK